MLESGRALRERIIVYDPLTIPGESAEAGVAGRVTNAQLPADVGQRLSWDDIAVRSPLWLNLGGGDDCHPDPLYRDTVKDFQDLLTNRQTLFHYEDIFSFVRDVLPVIQQEALRKHITVTLELPERQMKINTERNLLKMAIFTLLKNAVELTPDEGRVTVSVSGDDNSIRLVVADNGYGMPQEEIDAVCDPNTQLKSCRFGLGLPLIKQIMAEHMGEISVISEIGKGARVTLTFPVPWSGIPHVLSLPAVCCSETRIIPLIRALVKCHCQ